MKKLCVLILATQLVYSSNVAASEFSRAWIAGGSQDGKSSVGLGFRGEKFGVELGALLNGDYSSDDVLDYPVPHSSYVNLGKKRIDHEYGVDVLGFYNPNDKVSLYGGIGGYFGEERQVARSTVTGWLYTQSKKNTFDGALSVGLQYLPSEKFLLGVGYNSVRGANLQLGMRF